MDKAEQLLQAHLQFELARWTGESAPEALEELLDQLWDWAGQTRLEDLLPAASAVDTIRRWIDDWYLPDTVSVLIGNVTKRLIHLPVNGETRLGDVLDDQLIEAGTDLIVELKRLRESLITQATQSPVYAMLISNVMYSGIRDYLTGESSVAQKLPGMSRVLKSGAAALNRRVPGLEGAIEERLRRYIEANTSKTIRGSREFLLEALNDEAIRDLSDRIWDSSKDAQLTVSELLSDDEIDRLVSFVLAIWEDLRQTEYIQELITEGVYGFYDGYGSENIQLLLEHIGLSRDGLAAELQSLMPELLANAHSTGLLETWLEPRLRAFYASPACAEILAGPD